MGPVNVLSIMSSVTVIHRTEVKGFGLRLSLKLKNEHTMS